MSAPLLLDLSHTCHTRARTGIQRVVRSLRAALGARAVGITHDPHLAAWRELESWEQANLAAEAPAARRGAHWPVAARVRGTLRRWTGDGATVAPQLSAFARGAGLIVPEVFSPGVARALPALLDSVGGVRIALFHDAIALKFPELTPPKTVERFPAYLIELLQFDGIAAVSEDSRTALLDYWRWLGVAAVPPVVTISLGMDPQRLRPSGEGSPTGRPAPGTPVVLSVGSIEGRKNHLALLEACEQLWARGEKFSLRLIGLAQPQTGAAALARIATLQAAGRPLRYDGPVSDEALDTAYADCAFTVYPSLVEGFGLPVIESLAHGKPCVCSGRGALGEAARGGGCVLIDRLDATALTAALHPLLTDPTRVADLAAAAAARRFKGWSDYAGELVAWMARLPRRK